MTTRRFTVEDGPLQGQRLEVDLSDGDEMTLGLSDGSLVVYRAVFDRHQPSHTTLRYVGIDVAA